MKRSWIIGGLVVLVLIGGGLTWLILNKTTTGVPASDTSTPTTTTQSVAPAPSSTDMTTATTVDVVMKNTAFEPSTIKIKKGTKVVWTNQDSIQHNVVADSSSNAAGLPTTNSLLSKGESYSFTFNTVGTITYHCLPHASFMKGTVEVVE